MKLQDVPFVFPGIYSITNVVNNRVYIGCSNNCGNRLYQHIDFLIKNRHDNKEMQRDFLLYGIGAFDFSVLEKCSDDELMNRESEWVYKFSDAGITLYNKKSPHGTFFSVLKRRTECHD